MVCNNATRYDRQYSICVRNTWRGKNNVLAEADINTLAHHTLLLSCAHTNGRECKVQTDVYTLGEHDTRILQRFFYRRPVHSRTLLSRHIYGTCATGSAGHVRAVAANTVCAGTVEAVHKADSYYIYISWRLSPNCLNSGGSTARSTTARTNHPSSSRVYESCCHCRAASNTTYSTTNAATTDGINLGLFQQVSIVSCAAAFRADENRCVSELICCVLHFCTRLLNRAVDRP